MSLAPGDRLGAYEILSLLGAGGMGEVYRAHDERLDRDVAIKVLPESTFGDGVARARLLREARAAAALNHPHVSTIHEVGEASGQVYIVMELITGQPLDRLIPADGLPVDQLVHYALQIADAVAHAHECGVVHRDLKTANVLVTPHGRVKVLDFGLAKHASLEPTDAATVTRSVTEDGTIAGTLPYMAPELLRAEPATRRSDVWALGVMLHEMAAGKRPFQARTAFELSSAIMHQPPAPLPATVPLALRAVIDRCLEKAPERRYQRASEAHAALEAIHTGTVMAPPPDVRPDRRGWPAGRRLWLALTAVIAGAAALGGWWAMGRVSSPQIESLVVLPFDNVSGDPAQDYFVDGMTEAIMSDLAKISGLKVISRTSAMRYKGTDKRLVDIVRELGVQAAVEGSVQRVGDRVRITAQLIDGGTDTDLWSDSYDRDVTDVLFLQRELARAIAGEIRLSLSPRTDQPTSPDRRVDREAYEAYLLGRHYMNQRSADGLERAASHFQRAIERDATFANAYAGLADTHVLMEIYSQVPPATVHPIAKRLAIKALAIDPSLGEAHTSLAWTAFVFDFDWVAAEKEFEQAIRLSPGYATAHLWYGIYLSAMGRFDQAKIELARAVELDPLSPTIVSQQAFPFFSSGEIKQAMNTYRKAIAKFPDFRMPHTGLARSLVVTGAYEEAITEISRGEANLNDGLLGMAYGFLGRKQEALQVLQRLEARSRDTPVPAREYAYVYTGLGDHQRAMDWLERAYDERGVFAAWLKTWPLYNPLRNEPRFKQLLERMQFPD